jgi:protein TonB
VVTPVIAAPSTVKAEVVVPAAPVIPMQKTVSAPVQPAPVQRVSNGEAEGVFAQDVRSRIERKKIYPDTARDLGMSGEVEVTYELDRAGNLLKAEISSSSGFKLLDQAALRAVKSASYKSFPEDAWIGAGSKVFRTKLVFSIEQ